MYIIKSIVGLWSIVEKCTKCVKSTIASAIALGALLGYALYKSGALDGLDVDEGATVNTLIFAGVGAVALGSFSCCLYLCFAYSCVKKMRQSFCDDAEDPRTQKLLDDSGKLVKSTAGVLDKQKSMLRKVEALTQASQSRLRDYEQLNEENCRQDDVIKAISRGQALLFQVDKFIEKDREKMCEDINGQKGQLEEISEMKGLASESLGRPQEKESDNEQQNFSKMLKTPEASDSLSSSWAATLSLFSNHSGKENEENEENEQDEQVVEGSFSKKNALFSRVSYGS